MADASVFPLLRREQVHARNKKRFQVTATGLATTGSQPTERASDSLGLWTASLTCSTSLPLTCPTRACVCREAGPASLQQAYHAAVAELLACCRPKPGTVSLAGTTRPCLLRRWCGTSAAVGPPARLRSCDVQYCNIPDPLHYSFYRV